METPIKQQPFNLKFAMKKKNILITGCSTGIGAHCARRLAEDGWQVFATARKDVDLKRLGNEGLNPLYLDYTENDSIHSAFQSVLKQTDGSLDALFNNGAFGQPGAVEDLSTNVLRQQFEANFFGWHELTNLAVPVMRAQGGGRIVHCSSILGWVPSRWRGAYNASKFALEGLASTMRLELKAHGIHVALIEPGPISSKFTLNALAKLKENIDIEGSAHSEHYRRHMEKLGRGGVASRFRLGPDAVYKKLHHALTSKSPKAHYGVTVPTHVLDMARRFLPQKLVDRILLSGG